MILPRLWPRIRLTLAIILVFNLSVVDLAILLGPGNPPTLAVLLVTLVNDPGSRASASAGAVLLALLVVAVLAAGLAFERFVTGVASARRRSGARGLGLDAGRRVGQGVVLALSLASVASLAVLPIWSLAARWRFPDTLPGEWTTRHWSGRGTTLLEPALETLALALVSAALALLAAIVWLELERYRRAPRIDWLWYVPLLVPQVSLLFGWQAAALLVGVDGGWGTVLHSHWLYALPYVILILAVAWREHDPHWGHAAAVLGAGYWRVLWRIRLPLLVRPLSQAAAVAVAVSVAQYLPTLLLGAGASPDARDRAGDELRRRRPARHRGARRAAEPPAARRLRAGASLPELAAAAARREGGTRLAARSGCMNVLPQSPPSRRASAVPAGRGALPVSATSAARRVALARPARRAGARRRARLHGRARQRARADGAKRQRESRACSRG